MIEVTAWDDDGLFRLSQFNLDTETLTYTYVIGHFAGEDQIDVEHAVFYLGHNFCDAKRILFTLIVDSSRQSGGNAVDVVFAQ